MFKQIVLIVLSGVLGFFAGGFVSNFGNHYNSIYAEISLEQRTDLATFMAKRHDYKSDQEALDTIFSRFHLNGGNGGNGGWTRYNAFHVKYDDYGMITSVCLQPSDVMNECTVIIK